MKKQNNNLEMNTIKSETTDVRDYTVNGYNNLSPFQRPILPTSYYPFGRCGKNKKKN